MSIAELQLQLHQAIDNVTDSKKLEAIYVLFQNEKSPSAQMSLEEYISAIDEARQQINAGKFVSVDELEKESDLW